MIFLSIAITPGMLPSRALASASNLTVTSEDSAGNPITGYWTVIAQSGVATQSGFTPLTASLSPGSYDITVSDYGGYYFSHWSDGVSTRDHPVTLSDNPVALTAIYSTSSTSSQGSSIAVTSQYADGSTLSGMYTVLEQSGATISTGFTPASFTASAGQTYTVIPQDYTNAYFEKWSDGTTTRERTLTATSSITSLTAIYTTSQSSSGGGGSSGNGNLAVNSEDSSGNALNGYWTVVSQSGSTVSTGFTPLSTNLPAGSYDVSVGDFGGYYFNHWSDGVTTRDHQVSLGSGTTTLTAIYSTSNSGGGSGGSGGGGSSGGDGTGPSPAGSDSITVYARRVPSSYWAPCFALTCSAGTGPGAAMYVSLEDSSGNVIASGFADENGYAFTGLNPSASYYLVYPADCDYCHGDAHNVVFSHWQDGSSNRPREAVLGQSYTAYFEYVPLS